MTMGEMLTSPEWWVSVIVAGFVVSLAASYAKPVVDGSRSYCHRQGLVSEDAGREMTFCLRRVRRRPRPGDRAL